MKNNIFNSSDFFIETPMSIELEEKVKNWVWNGFLGGYILGNSRIGKTKSIRCISEKISNRYGELIPIHRVTIPRRDVATVASIFKNICYSLKMSLKNRVTANEMSNDLVHYFAELALQNKSKQVVIIVDEMQRLKVNQIEAFNELHDCLADLGLNLSIFFVGNTKTSIPLLKQIKTSNNDHIWGRFFKHEFYFHGLRSQIQLAQVLSEYDKTQTKKYLPKEYAKGWRIRSLSHLIWEVYSDNFKSKLTVQSWGMQYFTAMMRILLVDYLPVHGITNDENIKSMVYNSIEASGLVEELVRGNQC